MLCDENVSRQQVCEASDLRFSLLQLQETVLVVNSELFIIPVLAVILIASPILCGSERAALSVLLGGLSIS